MRSTTVLVADSGVAVGQAQGGHRDGRRSVEFPLNSVYFRIPLE